VTGLAQRLASFDKQALAEAKRALDDRAALEMSRSISFLALLLAPGQAAARWKVACEACRSLRFGDHLASLVQGDSSPA